MNYVPRMNRRAFVVGATALGSGLALGFDVPFGPAASHAAVGGPEVNAWVVVRPDETVVIRIARSEMGQGTLTGLAQLVAEELECDWSKVTYEFPTPGQNVARKRVWGDFFTAGSRGIRTSHELLRKGGAAARMMLVAGCRRRMESPGRGVHGRERGDHPQGLQPQHHLRQGCGCSRQDRTAAGYQAQGSEGLEDHRQRRQTARHRRTRSTARRSLRHRRPAARNALRRHQGLPCQRRQGQELRRGESHRRQRRQEGRSRSRTMPLQSLPTAGGSARTALDALPIVWDEGENAKVSSAIDCGVAEGRPRRRSGVRRQQGRRRQSRAWRVPPRRSRRSTPIPISTTSPWSPRTRLCATPPTSARSGARPRTASRRWRPHRRPAACRSPNAKSTRPSSAADSAGARPRRTISARRF